MRKLICEKDVLQCVNQGQKELLVTSGMLVTPLARDAARAHKVAIVQSETPERSNDADSIDRELIYRVFQTLEKKGLMQKMLEQLPSKWQTKK